MLLGVVIGLAFAGGVALIVRVHHRQWHVRLRRQIRALPEHCQKERV